MEKEGRVDLFFHEERDVSPLSKDVVMSTETIIGIAASVLSGTALLPQLIKTLREKRAGDISYGMMALLFGGLALWIIYGVLKTDWIIIISNSFGLGINVWLACMSIHYANKLKI